jgi:hypothetical protein
VAIEVARLAPHRVERLALVSTGTHPVGAGEASATPCATRGVSMAWRRWFRLAAPMIARQSPGPDGAADHHVLGTGPFRLRSAD